MEGCRGTKDQHTRGRRVVQLRPDELDLLQLPEALCPEVVDDILIAGLGRIRPELTAPLTSQAIRACPALGKIILQQAANAAASLSFPALKSEACRFEGHMVAMLVELVENLAENTAIAQGQQSGDILEQESFRLELFDEA